MIARGLFEKRALKIDPKHPRDPAIRELLGLGRESATGIDVDDSTALCLSAVWACVHVLCNAISAVPWITYERQEPRGKRRATEHPLYRILHHRPNPEQTSAEWLSAMMTGLGTRGNGLSQIVTDGGGRPAELWPLRPDRTRMVRREDGSLWYMVTLRDGSIRALRRREVFHVRGFSTDGLWGLSPIDAAREAIGLGLAHERYAGRFFKNDARPGGVLEHPGKLSTDAHTRLKTDWKNVHEGLDQAHRVAILEEGMKFHDMGVTPEAAEFVAGRNFQVRDIARFYNVPLHMIQDLERATFSNIEHQSIGFVRDTMLPWFRRFEQRALADLFTEDEQERYFAEFLVAGLERGDLAARTAHYQQMVMLGVYSPNDVRDFENQNPRDGGDTYYVPANFLPSGPGAPPLPVPPADPEGEP